MRFLRPCARSGCPELVERGYCEAHERPPWQHAEGYRRMRGVRWQKLRRRILIEEPWCGVCERAPSEQVDHITPIAWGGTDERSNLQGICRSCHENKTLSESRMGRGRGSSLRGEG